MQNWNEKARVSGHVHFLGKQDHAGQQSKKNSMQRACLGFVFIPEKYVQSHFTRMIESEIATPKDSPIQWIYNT